MDAIRIPFQEGMEINIKLENNSLVISSPQELKKESKTNKVKKPLDIPLGENIDIDNKTYVVELAKNTFCCSECAGNDIANNACGVVECTSMYRKDGNIVVLKKYDKHR